MGVFKKLKKWIRGEERPIQNRAQKLVAEHNELILHEIQERRRLAKEADEKTHLLMKQGVEEAKKRITGDLEEHMKIRAGVLSKAAEMSAYEEMQNRLKKDKIIEKRVRLDNKSMNRPDRKKLVKLLEDVDNLKRVALAETFISGFEKKESGEEIMAKARKIYGLVEEVVVGRDKKNLIPFPSKDSKPPHDK